MTAPLALPGEADPRKGSDVPPAPAAHESADARLEPQAPPGDAARRWKLVGRDGLDRAVEDALSAVVAQELGSIDPRLFERVQTSFVREFRARIQGVGRNLRAQSKDDFLRELERSNSELLQRRDEVERELHDLEHKIAALESGADAASGLRPAEVRSRVLAFLEERLRAARTRDELGRGLLEWTAALLDEDRGRRGVEDGSVVNEALDRYRRRVEKLRSALRDTEEQLAALARRSREEGIASNPDFFLGRAREAQASRLELLRRLFEENVRLRAALRGA